MKKYIYSMLLLAFGFSANAQQEFGTHFMTNVAQNNFTNPAAFGKHKVTVSLPSVYAGFYNSTFAPEDILEKKGSILELNVQNALNKLSATSNTISTNVNVETFAFSIQAKKLKLSFNHGVRVNSSVSFPKETLEFFWGGNGKFIDETVNVAPKVNVMAYQEFGMGVGYKVSENLTLGTRVKYLIGAGAFYTSNSEVSIYTDPDYYQLTANTDYLIHTAGIPEADLNDGEFFDFDFSPQDGNKNRGIAFDFGANLSIGEKINIQTSVLNLGKINWETEVNNYWSKGNFEFDGLDLQPVLDEGEFETEDLLDSLGTTFEFTHSQNTFSSSLPGQFYLTGTYAVQPTLKVGAMIFAQGFQTELTTAYGVNVQKDFGKWASLGGQYVFQNGGVHNFGASAALNLGPVQIFAMSDNLIPVFNPMKTQSTNVRFGINLLFGKIKTVESVDEEMMEAEEEK